jgi:hypothetical protein
MREGGRSSGGIPDQDRPGGETHGHGAADGCCVATMTSLNVPERVNELSGGAIRSFNTTTVSRQGVRIGNSGLEVNTWTRLGSYTL